MLQERASEAEKIRKESENMISGIVLLKTALGETGGIAETRNMADCNVSLPAGTLGFKESMELLKRGIEKTESQHHNNYPVRNQATAAKKNVIRLQVNSEECRTFLRIIEQAEQYGGFVGQKVYELFYRCDVSKKTIPCIIY